MSHKADAIALTCIDYRFRKQLHKFFEHELGIHAVDHMAMGGGVKKIVEDGPIRQWVFDNFDIAFTKHAVNRVILVNHQDCGAYGGSKTLGELPDELAFQADQLTKAEEIIRAKYPDKQVDGYLALLGVNNEVSFKKII